MGAIVSSHIAANAPYQKKKIAKRVKQKRPDELHVLATTLHKLQSDVRALRNEHYVPSSSVISRNQIYPLDMMSSGDSVDLQQQLITWQEGRTPLLQTRPLTAQGSPPHKKADDNPRQLTETLLHTIGKNGTSFDTFAQSNPITALTESTLSPTPNTAEGHLQHILNAIKRGKRIQARLQSDCPWVDCVITRINRDGTCIGYCPAYGQEISLTVHNIRLLSSNMIDMDNSKRQDRNGMDIVQPEGIQFPAILTGGESDGKLYS